MQKKQKGFSLIELMIVVGIILIIAAIAVPSLLSAKVAANESSAVAALRTLTTACETYSNTYARGYPPALANLGPSAAPDATAADLVDAGLASGYKSGYNFVLAGGSPDANGNLLTYTINANPASSSSGNRYFYLDQSGVITWSTTGPATSNDTPLQ
jgi:prepilin-type N-terminal cleavage/methylation domain-containing protein